MNRLAQPEEVAPAHAFSRIAAVFQVTSPAKSCRSLAATTGNEMALAEYDRNRDKEGDPNIMFPILLLCDYGGLALSHTEKVWG